MSPSANKLAKRYAILPEVAQALVDAGYRNPRAIEDASEAALQKVPGVGQALAGRLKGK